MAAARAHPSSGRSGSLSAVIPAPRAERALRGGLVAFAALHLAIGGLGLIVPVAFYETMADFGPRNDWLVRDVSLLYAATGAAMLAERFLQGSAAPYAWIPVGCGIHRCLGAPLLRLEMKSILETVMRRARLRPASRQAASSSTT